MYSYTSSSLFKHTILFCHHVYSWYLWIITCTYFGSSSIIKHLRFVFSHAIRSERCRDHVDCPLEFLKRSPKVVETCCGLCGRVCLRYRCGEFIISLRSSFGDHRGGSHRIRSKNRRESRVSLLVGHSGDRFLEILCNISHRLHFSLSVKSGESDLLHRRRGSSGFRDEILEEYFV